MSDILLDSKIKHVLSALSQPEQSSGVPISSTFEADSESTFAESEIFFSDESEPHGSMSCVPLTDKDIRELAEATSQSEISDPSVLGKYQAKVSAEAEVDYQSKRQNLIADLQHDVTATIEQEKESREQKRHEEEKAKIKYEHALAVTTVLKKAKDFLVQVSHPVVITPNNNVVALCHLYPSNLGEVEDVNVDSAVSVSEIREIADQVPEFVLLDNLIDTTISVCIDLAINMPETGKMTDDEMKQLMESVSPSELEDAGIPRKGLADDSKDADKIDFASKIVSLINNIQQFVKSADGLTSVLERALSSHILD